MVSAKEIIKADLMRSGNIFSTSKSWEIVKSWKLSKSWEPSKDFTKRCRSDNHHHRLDWPIRSSGIKWFNQLNLGTVWNILRCRNRLYDSDSNCCDNNTRRKL